MIPLRKFPHTLLWLWLTLLACATVGATGVRVGFDSLNRLTSITETLSGPTGSRVTGYEYDIAGNVLKRTQANGTVENSAYDPLGRRRFQQTLSGGQLVSCFSYGYDAAGSVTGIEESYASSTIPDRKVTNTYDRTYRLLFEKTDTLTTAGAVSKTTLTGYQYDAANNRTLKTVAVSSNGNLISSNTATAEYGILGSNSNQLVRYTYTDTATSLVSTYTYDLNGNRQTKSINGTLKETYQWDSRNRLTSLVQPSPAKTYRYGYDYRMRRVTRDESSAGGENTVCSFSGGTCAFEKVASAVRVEYVRGSDYGGGIGGILYSVRGGANSFNAYNSRGDVVAKTNSGGGVTWEATYEAFGTRTTESGTNPDRQKANTKEEDPTGLLNEGFRYRDLETGMFISRDPMGFVDGPNVYSYVQQNPWTKFDPEGLFWAFAVDAGFVVWDSVQLYRGKIDKAEYGRRMAITAASVAINAVSGGGFTGGGLVARAAVAGARVESVAVRVASVAERAAASAAIQAANHASDAAQAGASFSSSQASGAGSPSGPSAHDTSDSNSETENGQGADSPPAQKLRGSQHPNSRTGSSRGSTLHSDKSGMLPDQLREQFLETTFEMTKPGVKGQDVKVAGGKHPSSYPSSTWPKGVDYGDFKPDTAGGAKTFKSDQKRKWSEATHMLPYDPATGKLKN